MPTDKHQAISLTAYGKLVVTFDGTGTVDLDCVSCYDTDTWGKDDPKWSQGKLRRDLLAATVARHVSPAARPRAQPEPVDARPRGPGDGSAGGHDFACFQPIGDRLLQRHRLPLGP